MRGERESGKGGGENELGAISILRINNVMLLTEERERALERVLERKSARKGDGENVNELGAISIVRINHQRLLLLLLLL